MKLDYIFSAKIHLENAMHSIVKSNLKCTCKDESCDVCEWSRNIKSTLYDLEKIIERERGVSSEKVL